MVRELGQRAEDEMLGRVHPTVHLPLMRHLEGALDSSQEVYRCMDVAFVENLFWQVGGGRAASYWELMPGRLKELYLGFHSRAPVP